MVSKILCVAEKPAIAKAVAEHLSGGRFTTGNTRSTYVKNYEFNFRFAPPWGESTVVMTSVIGHLNKVDFPAHFKKWSLNTITDLFEANIIESVDTDKGPIAENIARQARYAQALFIWTDCDLEGEHIGAEVRRAAFEGNARIEVKRARFSNTERAHVVHAALHPGELDERQVNAVAARIELDLRIGAALTRFQSLHFQSLDEKLSGQPISYGSCQFPTLGFVVDRYLKVRNFKPEQFWGIKVVHRRDGLAANFNWDRHRLFDRMAVIVLFEKCLNSKTTKVTKIQERPTSKWKPLPLTTVELQKLGSMFLRMDSQRVMKIAEDLYVKGWISYPRTETDQFDKGIDLRKLVEKQTQDGRWGPYAQGLLDGGFRQPRAGRHDDKAHPPIHPVNHMAPGADGISPDHYRVYEFVVRRFLGCCSEDAKGRTTTIELQYGPESFHANGLVVLERNYLDVYTYDKWESSQQLPEFSLGEVFEPDEANITSGSTAAPGYLTEPELIALMDANGIGTDATMAEHISKIKEREYVVTRQRGGSRASGEDETSTRGGRGRGRGRGRGGSARGSNASGQGGGAVEFIPTPLGMALIQGYDKLGFEVSLAKPFLRKDMEIKMRAICAGNKGRREVVNEVIEQYRGVYALAAANVASLKETVKRYVVDQDFSDVGGIPGGRVNPRD